MPEKWGSKQVSRTNRVHHEDEGLPTAPGPIDGVLNLQRTVGNRATQEVLQHATITAGHQPIARFIKSKLPSGDLQTHRRKRRPNTHNNSGGNTGSENAPTSVTEAQDGAYARTYTVGEVSTMLDASEGRQNPSNSSYGHPRERHALPMAQNYVNSVSQQKEQTKTVFKSSADQDQAVTDGLNASPGQSALAKLDQRGSPIRQAFTASNSVGACAVIKKNRPPVDLTCDQMLVVMERMPEGGLHFVTAYPKSSSGYIGYPEGGSTSNGRSGGGGRRRRRG